jgi:hypothetical protein
MEEKKMKAEDLKLMRMSFFLKAIIILWSFYLSLQAESQPESIFYLCVSILFAGLIIFQADRYRNLRKRTTEGPDENSEDF